VGVQRLAQFVLDRFETLDDGRHSRQSIRHPSTHALRPSLKHPIVHFIVIPLLPRSFALNAKQAGAIFYISIL
jgi:hypothetical protein